MDKSKLIVAIIGILVAAFLVSQLFFATPVAGYNCYLIEDGIVANGVLSVNEKSCSISTKTPLPKPFYEVNQSNETSPISMNSEIVFAHNCQEFAKEIIPPIEKGYMDAFFESQNGKIYYCKGTKTTNI